MRNRKNNKINSHINQKMSNHRPVSHIHINLTEVDGRTNDAHFQNVRD